MAKLLDKVPIFVITFFAQQMTIIRDKQGTIIEGDEVQLVSLLLTHFYHDIHHRQISITYNMCGRSVEIKPFTIQRQPGDYQNLLYTPRINYSYNVYTICVINLIQCDGIYVIHLMFI